MQEDFLHYLWRLKRFELKNLTTTTGEVILIHQAGEYNFNAGPDFLNARIQIGNTLWAGNVEMHLKASDWLQHQHQSDTAYNNVILHVVLNEDQPIYRATGERIPCLELQKRIPPKISKIYRRLIQNENWIPCQHQFHSTPAITRNLWLDRLLVERLEEKTIYISQRLEKTKNDWEECFYQLLVRNFGVKVNTEAFDLLAQSISFRTLSRHKNNLLQIEALLFGQAGLLDGQLKDTYPLKLQKEYHFLQKKFGLTPIPSTVWKFMRMRPANFPTIRIAQLSQLIFQSAHLFSKILAVKHVKEIENAFDVKISNYWQTHYVFDKPSLSKQKSLGKSTIHLLIINTISPFLFLYGQYKVDEQLKKRALQILEEVPAEKNNIISKWKKLGVECFSAYQTQALLQLKNSYCVRKQCLRCAIGNAILT